MVWLVGRQPALLPPQGRGRRRGASSPEPRAEARAAQYESGLIGLVALRTRSHKEYTSDPTERKMPITLKRSVTETKGVASKPVLPPPPERRPRDGTRAP